MSDCGHTTRSLGTRAFHQLETRARLGTPGDWRPVRTAFTQCAFGIYLGGLGRGRYPIHGSGMRNRRPGLAHVCRSEQSHGRILGKEVGVPSPEVRLIFVAVGWLVCPAVSQSTCKMEVGSSKERVSRVT